MASSSYCLSHSFLSLKVDQSWKSMLPQFTMRDKLRFVSSHGGIGADIFGPQISSSGTTINNKRSFLRVSRVGLNSKVGRFVHNGKGSGVCASWCTSAQVSNSVFTLGTVAVLPFYALMVVAPRAELTKKSMKSLMPYLVLGLLYAYLLYLSWRPDTLQLTFANKNLLPELTSIKKLFSREKTLASAWIHLLTVDLFAARQVYHDGLQNNIETRHSISLCLFSCPVGILIHVITKTLSKILRKRCKYVDIIEPNNKN